MTPKQTYTQWQATRVRRWHTNPALTASDDPVGAHSARMMILALYFKPDFSRNGMITILQHDLAEIITGDVPYPVKASNPAFNEALVIADDAANKELGVLPFLLTPREASLIKLVDRLDAWFWMQSHTTDPHKRWGDYEHDMAKAAEALDVDVKFNALISTHHMEGSLR